MKNNFVKFILIFLFFVVSVKILYSAELLPTMTPKAFTGSLKLTTSTAPITAGTKGGSGIFGGKIVNTKAVEIEKAEFNGFTCDLEGGSSLSIVPIKGPTSFFIPFSTTSKTKRNPRQNGLIMGRYNSTKTISCKKACPPPEGKECSLPILLDKISLYGTS